MKYSMLLLLLGTCSVLGGSSTATAQPVYPKSPYYQPLNQTTPPGVAGQWAGALGRAEPFYFQPVKITLPGGGRVTFLDTYSGQTRTLSSPAQAGFLVGPLYRLRISDMPEFPGIELYPSVELVDRLHPPADLKHKYPVPIELTEVDIRQAMEDQLVTKIIYIEQPDLAVAKPEQGTIREEQVSQSKNLMTEADMRGRPVMYLRLGGRIPTPQELQGNPYQAPAPVDFSGM